MPGSLLFKSLLLVIFIGALLPLTKRIGPITFYTPDIGLVPLVIIAVPMHIFPRKKLKLIFEEKLLVVMLFMMMLSSILSLLPLFSFDAFFTWVRCGLIYYFCRFALLNGILTIENFQKTSFVFLIFLLSIGIIQLSVDPDFGLVANYFGANRNQGQFFGQHVRITGTSPNSNVFGQWLIVFSTIVNLKLFAITNRAKWLYLLLFLCLEFTVILYTLSRASTITFIFMIFLSFVIWLIKGRPARVFAFISLVLINGCLVFLLYWLAGQDTVIELIEERFYVNSDSGRIMTLRYGYELLKDLKILLFGTGPGTFFYTLNSKGLIIFPSWRDLTYSHSGIHNIFAALSVECGIFVVLLFTISYFSFIRKAFLLMQKNNWHVHEATFFVLLVAFLIPMQISNGPWSIWVLPFIVASLAVLAHRYNTLLNQTVGS